MEIKRSLFTRLRSHLCAKEITLLLGARQIGKTTGKTCFDPFTAQFYQLVSAAGNLGGEPHFGSGRKD
jgi:hypothetical protein